ncbi:alkene reductase [Flavobacterium frigoris]|nr:alkene reductase [Flavobacterium frigoris]
MSNSTLLRPFQFKTTSFSNRMAMAPMTRSRAGNEGNLATEQMAIYYADRADAGLLITEGTVVSKKAVGFINVPGIYSKEQTESWKQVTQAVHDKDGKIFVQLWHTGRLSHPELHNGELPHAPSAINPEAKAYVESGFVDTVTPKEMTVEEIKQTVLDFKNSAANAVEAGFDGVEIHASNGYLFHQFFNGASNTRTDEYGGSIENKARILFETLDALKDVIDYSRVGVRLNPSMHGVQGMTVDQDTIPTHEYIVNRLNDYGLAYVHFSEPFTDVSAVPFAVTEIAKHFRPIYKGLLMINKGFTKESGNQVIEDGYADMVAYGVPFIANPDLVARFEKDAPLNAADQSTFYTFTAKGYNDYPKMDA